jgi:hypothetical protein
MFENTSMPGVEIVVAHLIPSSSKSNLGRNEDEQILDEIISNKAIVCCHVRVFEDKTSGVLFGPTEHNVAIHMGSVRVCNDRVRVDFH